MAGTYCGKSCAECKQKEILSCAGCKTASASSCRIAKCCRDKGHQDCVTCTFSRTCATLRGKDHMPEYRLKAIEAEKCVKAEIAKRAPVLGKWLWVLFWLIIPNIVANILTNETVAGWIPVLRIPGQVLTVVYALAYGIVLIRLIAQDDRYRTAGICMLATGVVGILMCIPAFWGDVWWALTLALITAIVVPIGQYNEMTAHSVVLTGVDNELSEKWSKLWKWYIGLIGAAIGGVLLAFISPFLGGLVTLAAGIGMPIVGIVKLVYLYATAKRFREYKIEID